MRVTVKGIKGRLNRAKTLSAVIKVLKPLFDDNIITMAVYMYIPGHQIGFEYCGDLIAIDLSGYTATVEYISRTSDGNNSFLCNIDFSTRVKTLNRGKPWSCERKLIEFSEACHLKQMNY